MAESGFYLGMLFDGNGYQPNPAVLPQIDSYTIPANRKDVQSFLGRINYYRNHIPKLAAMAVPLYELTTLKNLYLGSPSTRVF